MRVLGRHGPPARTGPARRARRRVLGSRRYTSAGYPPSALRAPCAAPSRRCATRLPREPSVSGWPRDVPRCSQSRADRSLVNGQGCRAARSRRRPAREAAWATSEATRAAACVPGEPSASGWLGVSKRRISNGQRRVLRSLFHGAVGTSHSRVRTRGHADTELAIPGIPGTQNSVSACPRVRTRTREVPTPP